jgi:serine/threonine protein kinase
MKATKENSVLGDYKLSTTPHIKGKIIGEGTFGKVQLGIHIPTGEKVAIKILQK